MFILKVKFLIFVSFAARVHFLIQGATSADPVPALPDPVFEHFVDDKGPGVSVKCGPNDIIKLYDSFATSPKNCHKSIYFDSNNQPRPNIPPEQKPCEFVCNIRAAGMMDDTGKILAAGVKKWVEDFFPAPSPKSAEMIAGLNACADQFGSAYSVTPENCASVCGYANCTFSSLFNTCGYRWVGFMQEEQTLGLVPPTTKPPAA